MGKVKSLIHNVQFIHIYLLVYFIINIIFLTHYPFVHSDEPWLSGLSRMMLIENDFSVTEPFFDTYVRNPHAIKTLFHIIQMFFLKIFGYHIFSVRLISLIFSIGCLYLFNVLCKRVIHSKAIVIITTIILSADIQYLYASHFARQEIVILFFMLLSTNILLHHWQEHHYRKDIIIGVVVGISIGIHPNSFIVALIIGGMCLLLAIYKTINIKNVLLYTFIVTLFALLFIGISFIMDGNFIHNYFQTGVQFKVNYPITEKLSGFTSFYSNLYEGKSLTYYMPNIKFQLIIFTVMYFINLILFIKNWKNIKYTNIHAIFIAFTFVMFGIIIIGRFNPTSILFVFPFGYLLSVATLMGICNVKKQLLYLLLVITLICTLINLPSYKSSYNDYIYEISRFVDPNDVVLSNLNTEYYFENEKLFDYRNLSFLNKKDISFSSYVGSRNIEYIIYYDELDYIYKHNPRYNGVYGDVSSYYDDMQHFLHNKCHKVYTFTNSTYGTNISHLVNNKEWKIHIYKVLK